MAVQDFTLLDAGRAHTVPASIEGTTVRLAPNVLRAALGWELRPQGLCRGDACVPRDARPGLVDPDGVDLAGLADALARPLALDVDERAAVLGVAAGERAARLTSLEAPDFTLPDLAGTPHTLSDHRGKKVLLAVYASW